MKTILSIQGSRREIDEQGNKIPFEISNKSIIMKKYGFNVITPETYWYSDSNLYETIKKEIDNNQIDAIMGNSAGGYMGYYLSNFYNLPCLLLNPALAKTSEAPTIQKLPENIINSNDNGNKLIVIGNRDLKVRHGVDFNLVLEFLQSKNFFNIKTNKLFVEQGVSHSISIELFEKYFIKFKDMFF
jgi:hypothetical protein